MPEQFTYTNRPIFKTFIKFLILSLGYILDYAKDSVRPYIQYVQFMR